MTRILRLSLAQEKMILNHVIQHLPEEACGLLGGQGETVSVVIPVTNSLHSPVRFRMDPAELLKALEWLDTEDLDLVGIFHSHPRGPATPSETDLHEFAYPESLMLIVSPVGKVWRLRAFEINIEKRTYEEARLIIELSNFLNEAGFGSKENI
ncbi:M67 family metallopeptidase [uncultured Thermanaerothrix sp.]|uniref:M67 family metallopeptidase n=1 Tax=uncultured Thermanaerothrix sp. TaxID=1195149 RepID=UPI0026241E82|nr:M67 family metallopeptidase [uncultured Thermanaerothrix sp.]